MFPTKTIEISDPGSVSYARHAAGEAADSIGFSPPIRDAIVLAVSELGTNLQKHAHGGKLILRETHEPERIGLEIESLDSGPGIADIEQAMTDGFSTTGSLGDGLGTINRIMDEFTITSRKGGSTRIFCRKWIPSGGTCSLDSPLDLGAATRPHPNCDINGDAFVMCQWNESSLVGIIDGLGHGPGACLAAQVARNYVESHFDLPLGEIFSGAGRACHNTRGVVMALARFDWGIGKLHFASVGDVESRVLSQSGHFGFVLRRGIVGLNAPAVIASEHLWDPQNILVLHSDGIISHWKWEDFPRITEKPAGAIANELLRALAKDNDDATVLVVRSALV